MLRTQTKRFTPKELLSRLDRTDCNISLANINSKYMWNFLIKLQVVIYFAQRQRHSLCIRALHQTQSVLNSSFSILRCIWQHEPRSQMGALRMEASRKTVAWTPDKTWLGLLSGDLPENSGMLFWALWGGGFLRNSVH